VAHGYVCIHYIMKSTWTWWQECNGSFQGCSQNEILYCTLKKFNEMLLGIYWVAFCDRSRTRYIKLLITSTLLWLKFEKFNNGKCDLFFVSLKSLLHELLKYVVVVVVVCVCGNYKLSSNKFNLKMSHHYLYFNIVQTLDKIK
jgi:hypothetical protein